MNKFIAEFEQRSGTTADLLTTQCIESVDIAVAYLLKDFGIRAVNMGFFINDGKTIMIIEIKSSKISKAAHDQLVKDDFVKLPKTDWYYQIIY